MEINKEIKNFIKLQELINRSTVVLRRIFINRWKSMTGKEWLNSKETAIDFINGKGLKVYSNAKRLQRICLKRGDIEKWDFSLIANVLQSVQFSICGQKDREYLKQVKEENQKFQSLSKISNKCVHNSNMCLTDEQFNDMSNEMIAILISFGESEEELEIIKYKHNLNETESNSNSEIISIAEKLKQKGNEFYAKHDFNESIAKYSEALALKGLNNELKAVLYSNRSKAYLKLIEFSSITSDSISTEDNDPKYMALLDAKQCLELSPFWWKSYYRMGSAYHVLKKYSKAIHNFDRALALEPSKEEVKSARDSSRYECSLENRFEHLDESHTLLSTNEYIWKLEEKGFNMTEERFKLIDEDLDSIEEGRGDVMRGHKHFHGLCGYKQDYVLSAQFFSKAADKSIAEGIYNLGLMYNKGLGVKQDHNMAVELYKRAAKLSPKMKIGLSHTGVAESQHSLGLCYETGVGVSKDPVMAMKWYFEASKNGSAESANNLGLIYKNGVVVDRNLLKAEQYFLLSASRNDSNSMLNLAQLYLELKDTDNARVWLKRAIENGNGFAKMAQNEYFKSFSEVEKEWIPIVSKFESKYGLSSEGLTLKQRIERVSEGEYNPLNEYINYVKSLKSPTLPGELKLIENSYSIYDLKIINEYVEKGSEFALRMQKAMSYYIIAINALIEMVSKNDMSYMFTELSVKFIQNLAHSIRTESIIPNIPIDLRDEAILVTNNVLKFEGNTKSQIDIDARLCYAYFHSNSLDETIAFLKQCSERYPNEYFFHKLRGCLFAFKQNFSEGLNEMNMAFNLSPNDYDLRYERAAIMRLKQSFRPKHVIKAYSSFLEIAPKDHRKVPESYYAMAFIVFTNKGEQKQKKKDEICRLSDEYLKVKSYFEKGLEAEKIQLPFFLPYQSNHKSLLEMSLKMIDIKDNNFKPNFSNKTTQKPNLKSKSIERLTDPKRIELIREHKEFSLKRKERKTKDLYSLNITFPALKQQKASKSISDLKPITLKDMKPTRDHVYEGYVMQITFIEDAITGMTSISTLFEDENGDIQRCFIYNFKYDRNECLVQKTFGFGIKWSLINPYMRMAMDGKPAICIDDPKSLIEFGDESKIKNMCRYCCSADAKHVCGRCERAYYCDRKCQTNDWNVFKHKLICFKTNVE